MSAGLMRRATRRVAATSAGAWLFAHVLYRLDAPVFRLTHGRHTLASLISGLPVVILTTTGARTGQPRAVPVVALPTSLGLIVIASNFGRRQQPAWYHNLRAHPLAAIADNTGTRAVRAVEITGEPRERAWREALAVFPAWSAYEHRAGNRYIALFRLIPSEPTRERGTPMPPVAPSARARRIGRSLLACSLLAALPALTAATTSTPATAATGGVVTYGFTGTTQTFTVPAGVTQITVLAVGAAGGAGSGGPGSAGAPGGFGGSVSATLRVTPGQALTIDVGHSGADAQGRAGGGGGGTPGFQPPYSGDGGGADSAGAAGGGGGGAAVQTGGANSFPVLVAGGGGGGGGGGAVVGEDGGAGGSGGRPPGGDGAGGSGSGAGSGGAGGRSLQPIGNKGQSASQLLSAGGGGGGGFGVNPNVTSSNGVGGGGTGGTAGGAGGGGGGGGGAGSSYVTSSAIGTPTYATATARGDARLSIFYSAPVPITTLSASPNPARPGTVSFTTAVAPPAGVTGPAPTGTVSFFVNGSSTPAGSPPLTNGTATWSTSLLAPGTSTVRAVYNGDTVYDSSASTTLTETVVTPTVTTGVPSSIGPTTATLTGTVNPNGVASTPVEFEYGTTATYGTLTSAQALTAALTAVPVHAALTGLTPNTTYHYRVLVAPTLTTGLYPGADRTLTTSASGQLAITTTTLATAIIGRAYTTTLAGAGGTTPYHWSLAGGTLPAGLTLASTGVVTGTPTTRGTSSFIVAAKDSAAPTAASATKSLTLTVNPVPVMVTTALLPVATSGQAYSANLTASGGTAPYHWSVSAGSLPSGLTLNPTTGAITGTPTTSGASSFTIAVADSTSPTPQTDSNGLALLVQPRIAPGVFVVNGGYSGVDSYDLTSGGNLAPRSQITGNSTGQLGTTGITIDTAGRLYVTNAGNNSVTEYPNQATGNATPTATIAGNNTGLNGPQADTLDAAGRLYVANEPANTITVYANGASGNAAPALTLGGSNTQLSGPQSLAIDPAGHLFVGNANNTITEYAASATGNAAPIATIAGPDTGINSPQALTIDAAGNLLVANTYGERLTEYPLSAHGDAAPIRVISGTATGLDFPDGLDIDTAGNIYVANQFGNSITEYAANAAGNATPIATITGPSTGLSAPGRLAVTPPLSVLTTTLPKGLLGVPYRATLHAGLGTPPYRWRVTRGHLPRGLHLDTASGRITGTPRTSGTYRITVSVIDQAKPATHATQRISLTIQRRRPRV